MHVEEFSTEVGGKKLSVRFTDLTERAHGSALVSYGNTTVLATAVMADKPRVQNDPSNSFLPLTVDYEEKFYASGKILGSQYVRREGRPSDQAILSGRIVDRTIRPLFDQWIRNEIQVTASVLSIDQDDPDILAVIAGSLALAVSPIPWNGPISAVRIGKWRRSDTLIINPSFSDRANPEFEFELLACGKDGEITMLEMSGKEVSETIVLQAIKTASLEIEKIQQFQKEILKKQGGTKIIIEKPSISEQISALFNAEVGNKMESAIFTETPGGGGIEKLRESWGAKISTLTASEKTAAHWLFEEKMNELLHTQAIEKGRRPDGRRPEEIRPIHIQAGGISPMAHGSGIFYRGQTHVFSALTLGGPKDGLLVDNIEEHREKHFIHHYNFPPFSTGETGRMGGLSRRSIGHGALAEKALLPVIPDQATFPYTIRLVSEALSSNGSTSMASVCASTVALMDGGVPITRPVAGISCGLMTNKDPLGKAILLTDIQGPEDHYGDMDFKVAGTRQGITAIQLDVKIPTVSLVVLKNALERNRIARLTLLDRIEKVLPKPRADLAPHAPRILRHQISPSQIGLLIGPGGKTIRAIKEQAAVDSIDVDDSGIVFIAGKKEPAQMALRAIKQLTEQAAPVKTFFGRREV